MSEVLSGAEFKKQLRAGKPKLGLFVDSHGPTVTEQLAHSGYDWLLVDTQHGPMGYETLSAMLAGIAQGGAKSLVRVSGYSDRAGSQQTLDMGADGVLIPYSNNADEARQAVSCARYPTPSTAINRKPVVGSLRSNDPAFTHRELDVELARIGNVGASSNSQFVAQPRCTTRNLVPFQMPLNIKAAVYSSEGTRRQCAYPRSVPKPTDQNVRMNTWLLNSKTSTDGQGPGIVIEDFESVPDAMIGQARSLIAGFYGIDFSPYLDGQNLNFGFQLGVGQSTSRLQIVALYTNWVRSFGNSNDLEKLPSIVRESDLKVAADVWISSISERSLIEIQDLNAAANVGLVDVATVGSEAVLRNGVTGDRLISYVGQGRQAVPANIPVTTVDVSDVFNHPHLIAGSEVVVVNLYPDWEGTSTDNAVCSFARKYQQVVMSETGWPSDGNGVGVTVSSLANATLDASQVLIWTGAYNIPAFYFEAFDEAWKIRPEGTQSAQWGIWDTSGFIKPWRDAFFSGQASPINHNCSILGPIDIRAAYVPPYGSSDQLEVRVKVLATYLKVFGGWWTKPAFAQPMVAINSDGTERRPIVTGGSDHLAMGIDLFMIPSGTVPPAVRDDGLPTFTGSVAPLQFNRTQGSIGGKIATKFGVSNVSVLLGNGDGAFQLPMNYWAGSNPYRVQPDFDIEWPTHTGSFSGAEFKACLFKVNRGTAFLNRGAIKNSPGSDIVHAFPWSTQIEETL